MYVGSFFWYNVIRNFNTVQHTGGGSPSLVSTLRLEATTDLFDLAELRCKFGTIGIDQFYIVTMCSCSLLEFGVWENKDCLGVCYVTEII